VDRKNVSLLKTVLAFCIIRPY